jgi:hypothetical protein
VSITKLQRTTAAAADLIAICQSVTADGRLAEDEVLALRQWLEDHQETDLPAHGFLARTIETILADGQVTADEQRDLYTAIETVLPPDIRASVRGTRVAIERDGRDAARRQKTEQRAADQEERARNRPTHSWDFMVAGVRYEDRAEAIRDYANEGDPVRLVREHGNEYRTHAIQIQLADGLDIGYVPEQIAREIAPLLDAGSQPAARIKKILDGGRVPIPVVIVRLSRADATLATAEAFNPAYEPRYVEAAEIGAIHPVVWARRARPRTNHP